MDILRIIVVVVAVLALIKGVWLLAAPGSAQRFVDWWLGMPAGVARQLGILTSIGGLVLIGLAVAAMRNATVAVVTVLGTLWVLAGLIYLWPPALQALGKPFGSAGARWWMRLMGGVALLVGAILLIIYLSGP